MEVKVGNVKIGGNNPTYILCKKKIAILFSYLLDTTFQQQQHN